MGRPAALLDLGVDRPGDVVPGRQLGRAAGIGRPAGAERLDPARRLLVGRGVLVAAVLGQVLPHEPLAILVAQDPALAADRLGDQQAPHAGRPDHAGRVELDELHVDELRPGQIGQGLAVARVLPRVRGDLERPAHAAGRQDDGLGREDDRLAGRPPAAEGAPDAVGPGQQVGDRALHVDRDPGGHRPVLEGPDHLQPGPVADVGQPRMRVPAERPLEDPPVVGPIEDRPPGLELADPVGRLLGVELGHPRVVEELAADHRVPKVDLPRVFRGDVAEGRRDAAFGHHRVGLAQQRLADQPDIGPRVRRGDRGTQPRAPGADDQDVVRTLLGAVAHRRIDRSTNQPAASARTYRSARATVTRLAQAQRMWLTLRPVSRCQSV